MQRNLIIASVVAIAVIVLGVGAYLILLSNGDDVALARLDRLVRDQNGEYQNATYDVAEDRLVVEGLILRDFAAAPDAEPLDLIAVGHLNVVGLARFRWRDVLFSGRAQRIFEHLSASDIALTESGQTIRITSIAMEEVSFLEGNLDREETLTRSQVLGRALLQLDAEEIQIAGFSSPAEGPTGMQLSDLRITGVHGGAVDTVTAQGLRLWDQGQIGTVGDTVRLQSAAMSLANLDARVPLTRLAAGGPIEFSRQSDIPLYRSFSMNDLTVEQEGGQPLTVDSLQVENEAYEGPMPTQSTWSLSALRVPFDGGFVDQQEVAVLRDLGYEDLVFNFRYGFVFDVATQDFDLSDVSVGIEDMMDMEVQLHIRDVPFTEDMIDSTTDALLSDGFVTAVLEHAAVQGGRLSVTDRGVFERVVNLNAGRAGIPPEEYLQASIEELEAKRIEVASSTPAVQTIDALITFLQDPTSITVTIAPDEAVPLHQLIVVTQINPLVLVELLNLEVSAGD